MASPELLAWCRQGGVEWNGIEAGYVAEGWRGVIATRDLPPGTCVLRVPRRLLMSVESARRDAALAGALQHLGGAAALSSEQLLAAHLLHECSKGPASFWRPYLTSLPRSYTTAMCFGEPEAAALQAPAAVALAHSAAAAAAEQHAGALPLLRALGLATNWRSRAAWVWAASTLSSRTMYLPFDSAGALTPFGDLHNYRPPPPPFTPTLPALRAAAAALSGGGGEGAAAAAADSTAAAQGEAADCIAGDGCLDEGTNQYCIYTRAGCQAGDQVFLCYGRHTNLELLQHYGFVLADNPHDTAALSPRLLSPAARRQLAGDGAAGGDGSGEDVQAAAAEACYLHANGAPSWELLRALRLGCATPAERKASACRALADQPISAASERAAFEALQRACRAALAEVPTTAAEDDAELARLRAGAAEPCLAAAEEPAEERQRRQQQAAAAERMQVALEWRLCHKRILHRGEALCAAVLGALPPALGQPPAAADMGSRLAALQRKPRW